MVAAKTPQECLELYFTALHDNDGAAFDGMFSKEGRLLGIGPDGAVELAGALPHCRFFQLADAPEGELSIPMIQL